MPLKPVELLSKLKTLNPDFKCPMCKSDEFAICSNGEEVHTLGVSVHETIAGTLLPTDHTHGFYALVCDKCSHTLFFNTELFNDLTKDSKSE